MLPVLFQPSWESTGILLRMWAIVLIANIAGTLAFAWLLSRHDLFDPEVRQALSATAAVSVEGAAIPTLIKAMLAGWMIALMVWVLPSAEAGGLFIIVMMTYVIALGQFSHIIAGSTEAAYAVMTGAATSATIRTVLSAHHLRQYVRRGRADRAAQPRAGRL